MMAIEFGISVDTDDATGEVIAVYFQIRRGKVHETREFADGAAFADYSKQGEILGIELLSPCNVSIVDEVAAQEPTSVQVRMKRFMRQAGPRQMVAA